MVRSLIITGTNESRIWYEFIQNCRHNRYLRKFSGCKSASSKALPKLSLSQKTIFLYQNHNSDNLQQPFRSKILKNHVKSRSGHAEQAFANLDVIFSWWPLHDLTRSFRFRICELIFMKVLKKNLDVIYGRHSTVWLTIIVQCSQDASSSRGNIK